MTDNKLIGWERFQLLLVAIIFVSTAYCQFQFDPHTVVTSTADLVWTETVDLDFDGDIDVLCASRGNDILTWHENGGTGSFKTHVISEYEESVSYVASADFDGDNDLDLLVCATNDNQLSWFENDGSFHFTKHLITGSFIYPRSFPCDLDSDGDEDIVAHDEDSDQILWFQNNGSGSFSSLTLVNGINSLRSFKCRDLDDDGNMDLVVGNGPDLHWYENNGNQMFSAILIEAGAYLNDVDINDIDLDGDLDIVFSSGEEEVGWYSNDGSENFAKVFVDDLPNNQANLELVYAFDIEQDGDVDIVCADWQSNSENILFWQNDGNMQFNLNIVTNDNIDLANLNFAYIDQDLHIDIVSSPDNIIGFYKNDGFQDFTLQMISDGFNSVEGVFASDMDNDSDIDLLAAVPGGYKLAWFENNGSNDFEWHIIDDTRYSGDVIAADVDSDGDQDVVAHSENELTWYENDGSQSFLAHVVQYYPNGIDFRAIEVIDLDGDGDMDLISGEDGSPSKIKWYENDGNQTFSAQLISANTLWLDGIRAVYCFDIDGDGDLDVAFASAGDDTVGWCENDGNQNFTAIGIWNVDYANDVECVDLDQDSDIDLISGSRSGGLLEWLENDGSQDYDHHYIFPLNPARLVDVHDIDQDGDLDLFGLSTSTLRVLRNDGLQSYTEFVLSESLSDAEGMFSTDIDQDGDIDVLTSSSRDGKITWFENKTIVSGILNEAREINRISVNLHPMPSTGIITFEMFSDKQGEADLTLFDEQLRQVHQVSNLYLKKGINSITIDLQHLSSGTFIYQVHSETAVMTDKLTIIK